MHTLLTAVSVFFALLSTAFAFVAYAQANRANDAQLACARAAGKLNAMTGRVIALEGALEQLQSQHRKLSGKFHAAKNSDTPATPDVGPAAAGVRTPPPYCPNFHAGQTGGPMSPAASCECDYCTEMRARRAETKAELMPAARAATLAASRTRE